MTRAIVIGSGMAGLTAAAHLAMDGCQVKVFEQAGHIGGVTATFERDGFRWDIGPMILEGFGPGEPVDRILKRMGLGGRLTLSRHERGLHFPDYAVTRPEEYGGPDWRVKRLKELFPHEAANIDRFYVFLRRSFDLITLDRYAAVADSAGAIPLKLGMLPLFLGVKKYVHWNARQLMDHFFTDEKLKIFFLVILVDMTLLTDEYPALGVPFSNQETYFDRRVPPHRPYGIGPKGITLHAVEGGCGEIVKLMEEAVVSRGGSFHVNSTVERILVEGDRAVGVRLAGGEEHRADLAFASGDARHCFFNMIGRERLPREFAEKIDDIPLMESVFMVHLGVDMDVTPWQDTPVHYHYNIYDIDAEVSRMRSGLYHKGKSGFLIYIPSLHSPQMAPPGKHAVTVYTVAPNRIEGGWDSRKGEMIDTIVDEAEVKIPGLRKHTVTRWAITPKDFGILTHMREHHSFGGFRPVINKTGAPHRTPYRGLWFIGCQSESGPGVWTQIISARSVFKKARRDL
ncbi:MAG: NAD(P)/FAD-dependent oxidoreductase [Spirochaetes bacterium]|nr:NAD(P)/FAD-dependent oxidoreductase [Spirochaetota bacterium]